MISEIKVYRKDRLIPSLLKMWPRKQFNYDHFVHKIEDVSKMVVCNGTDGAVVCTWQSKFCDANGERKKGECLSKSLKAKRDTYCRQKMSFSSPRSRLALKTCASILHLKWQRL